MLVHVTEADILEGERGNERSCPVALAVQREVGGIVFATKEWIVTVKIGRSGRDDAYRTPKFVRRFIRDYDEGLPVTPFEFEADPE